MADEGRADWRVRLVQAVQTNCDIADARHATDLSLCTYLLQMREFFRWERELPYGAALPQSEVGNWIAAREARWQAHEGRAAHDYEVLPIPLPGGAQGDVPIRTIAAFDVEAANAALLPRGLLYGAGLVDGARPVFFLAELHALGAREGLRVQQAGHELARGLAAPPAALAAGAAGPIVLRRESMARQCWERYEAFRLRPLAESAFGAVVRAYDFERGFEQALPRWLDDHIEVALLHELGEHDIGQRLGAAWSAMRARLPTRRALLQAAAVRDQRADLARTLPALLERGASASLHAWFAAYDGLREAYFPALAEAYRAWRDGDGGQALRGAAARGEAHFEALVQRLLACHAAEGAQAGTALAALLDRADAVCA
ncbi:MAG: hypothetical protein KGL78_11220 [Burkholderiales bacterium]|nr:hypothetical protein [Burkholderiales bacterium]